MKDKDLETIFFPIIKTTSTKDASLQVRVLSFSSPITSSRQLKVLIQVFELSVCSFEIYNKVFLLTVLTSFSSTVTAI